MNRKEIVFWEFVRLGYVIKIIKNMVIVFENSRGNKRFVFCMWLLIIF